MRWPAGIGAKGNEGVANNVANTQGSIGYVEYAYALQNKLSYARMINKAGKTVAPTSDAFQAAAANADWKSQPGYGVLLANQPGDASWPITAPTWILIYKQPKDVNSTREALKFFAWAYANGGKMADELHYVPMPANVVKDIQNMWATDIKDAKRPADLRRVELTSVANGKDAERRLFQHSVNSAGTGLHCKPAAA